MSVGMLADTKTSWGQVSKSIHWLFVVLVAAEIYLGFWLAEEAPQAQLTGDDTLLLWLEIIHHTTGFILLIFAVFRLSWRLSNTTPDMPRAVVVYQKILAKAIHVTLYILMFVFPLSGWATSSVIGSEQFPVAINFFAFDVPELGFLRSFDPPYSTFSFQKQIHPICWWVGSGVL